MSEGWISGVAGAPTRRGLLGSGVGVGALALLVLAGHPAEATSMTETDEPPLVHPRKDWNAGSPKCKAEVLRHGPDHIVVHHTATPNSPDVSLAHAYQLSRQIQRFHMKNRGWNDIGEQLTISRGGYVMEGRNGSLKAIMAGRNVIGAQTRGHNQHTLGIENEGNYTRSQVPDRLWSALTDVCEWLCRRYELDPFRAIVGHRDFNPTDCPGDVLYARLPELRRHVARRLSRHDSPTIVKEPPLPGAESTPAAHPPLVSDPSDTIPPGPSGAGSPAPTQDSGVE
jgi:hypothetical protein